MALPQDMSPQEKSFYERGQVQLAMQMYQKRTGRTTKPTPPTPPSRAPRVIREEIAARPKPIPPTQPPMKEPATHKFSAQIELTKRQVSQMKGDKFIVDGKEVNRKQVMQMLNDQQYNINKYLSQREDLRKHNIDPDTMTGIWSNISLMEQKYYPGSKEHFDSIYSEDYLHNPNSQTLQTLRQAYRYDINAQTMWDAYEGYRDPPNIRNFTSRVSAKIDRSNPDQNQAIYQAAVEVLWEDLTTVAAYDKWYDSLHPIERWLRSFSVAFLSAAVGVVTLPELIIEEGVGRLITGKPIDIPLGRQTVAKYLEQRRSGPRGPIGLVTEKVFRDITGRPMTPEEKQFYAKEAKKYPIESLAAGYGEVAGMYVGAKALHLGSAGAQRAAHYTYKAFKAPLLKMPKVQAVVAKLPKLKHPLPYYKPTEVLKRQFYKKVSTQVPERTWLSEPTEGGWTYSYPKLTMKGFKKFPGKQPGTYEFGTATGYRWRAGRLVKAKTLPGERPTEMLGPSISPKGMVQRRFLRLKWQPPAYESKISLLPKLKRPAVMAGETKVAHLPKYLRKDTAAATKFAAKKPDTAYIATKHYMGGFEPEAKIAPGIPYKREMIAKEWFVEAETGKAVTVDYLKLFPKKPTKIPTLQQAQATFKKHFTYSSSAAGPKPVTLKPYSLPSYSSPSKPSYPSYPSKPSQPSYPSKVSYPSYPSKPSYPSYPSKPSKPSYPSYPSYPSKPSAPSKVYPIYAPSSSKTKSKRKQESYNTHIKINNKWNQITTQPLTLTQAKGLGADTVDKSTAIYFKVTKSTRPPSNQPRYEKTWKRLKHKFIQTSTNTYKEKTTYQKDFDIEKQEYSPYKPQPFKMNRVKSKGKAKQKKYNNMYKGMR